MEEATLDPIPFVSIIKVQNCSLRNLITEIITVRPYVEHAMNEYEVKSTRFTIQKKEKREFTDM